MHYRNWRKIILSATAIISAAALNGCATPKHTNLLVFGTNTVLGLKVGADATQTPSIQLAYARQELVLMPLLANTSGKGADLTPCPSTAVGQDPPANVPVNCKFIGRSATDDIDSYSVLASFGAKGNASQSGGEAKAGGAIAQYFATGLAARVLATHGSSLVAASESATTEAASESIYASPELRAAIDTARDGVVVREAKRQIFRDAVAAKIADSANYRERLANIDKDLGLNANDGFVKGCSGAQSAAACAAAVKAGALVSYLDVGEWEKALAAVLK